MILRDGLMEQSGRERSGEKCTVQTLMYFLHMFWTLLADFLAHHCVDW